MSAVASCSKDSEAPKVAPGAVAGKVAEVSGKVVAAREGQSPRTLAAGAEIYADDTVETAADGSVVIELFHNNARWSVEAGRKARVDASMAWKLAKQAPSSQIEHNTAAAARNAERQGADTGATVAVDSEPSPAPAAQAAPVAAAPPAEERADSAPGGAEEKPRQPERAKRATGATGAIGADATAVGRVGGKAGATTGTRGLPPAPLEDAPKKVERASDDALAGTPPPPPPARALQPSASEQIRALLAKQRSAFLPCVEGAKLTIMVQLVGGTPITKLGTGDSPKARTCVAKVITTIDFPAIDGQGTFVVEKK